MDMSKHMALLSSVIFASINLAVGFDQGCNGDVDCIPCCADGFILGDNDNGVEEMFIQAGDYKLSCVDSCKSLYNNSIGITESVKQKYSSGNGKNKNKCWCEFGNIKLDAGKQNYQTCVFCDEVIFITVGYGTYTSSELVDVAPSGAGCGRVTGKLTNRYKHSMDLLNGKLVICGGYYTETSCIAASSPSGPWSAHSTTTGQRHGHGSSTVGGAIYLIGGSDSASMETWENDRWITKKNPPVNFGRGTCATNVGNNQILVIGGVGSLNKVALYRVKEDVWEELGEVPVGRGRWFHGCVALGDGQVLVGGGYDGSSTLRSCGIYHIREGRWEDVGDMNSAKYGLRYMAVNVAGKKRFYALGGYDGSKNLDSIEEFNENTKAWGVSPVRMAEGRSRFGAVVLKKTNVCS